MGTDFIRNKRQQHSKAWSAQFRSRSVDLFAGTEPAPRQVFRATNLPGHILRPGDEVIVRTMGDGTVVVTRDISQVAVVHSPAPNLLNVVEQHDGLMQGTVYQCFEEVGVTDIEYEV